jgi:hypothetical protein
MTPPNTERQFLSALLTALSHACPSACSYNVYNGILTPCGLFQLWLYKPNPFSLDVKFNEDGTRIIASRLLIQAVNISDTNGEKEMVRALRTICHQSPLNVSVFHPYFVFFDQVNKLYTQTLE